MTHSDHREGVKLTKRQQFMLDHYFSRTDALKFLPVSSRRERPTTLQLQRKGMLRARTWDGGPFAGETWFTITDAGRALLTPPEVKS